MELQLLETNEQPKTVNITGKKRLREQLSNGKSWRIFIPKHHLPGIPPNQQKNGNNNSLIPGYVSVVPLRKTPLTIRRLFKKYSIVEEYRTGYNSCTDDEETIEYPSEEDNTNVKYKNFGNDNYPLKEEGRDKFKVEVRDSFEEDEDGSDQLKKEVREQEEWNGKVSEEEFKDPITVDDDTVLEEVVVKLEEQMSGKLENPLVYKVVQFDDQVENQVEDEKEIEGRVEKEDQVVEVQGKVSEDQVQAETEDQVVEEQKEIQGKVPEDQVEEDQETEDMVAEGEKDQIEKEVVLEEQEVIEEIITEPEEILTEPVEEDDEVGFCTPSKNPGYTFPCDDTDLSEIDLNM